MTNKISFPLYSSEAYEALKAENERLKQEANNYRLIAELQRQTAERWRHRFETAMNVLRRLGLQGVELQASRKASAVKDAA